MISIDTINKVSQSSWLADARVDAQDKPLGMVEVRKPVSGPCMASRRRPSWHGTLVPTHATFTRSAAYRPVLTARPMGAELTTHIANGGVQGPYPAWREPVIT